jgi:para-aminobenzoate synthetase component I
MFYSAALPYRKDATAYYAAIADLPWSVWLDSGGRGRYDIIAAQPVETLLSRNGETRVSTEHGCRSSKQDAFSLIRELLGSPVACMDDMPFTGGALGYWGYDLARSMTTLPAIAADADKLPDMAIGIYDWALVLDHQRQTARLVSHQLRPVTAHILPQILARLQRADLVKSSPFQVHGRITSNFSREHYRQAFAAIQAYLRDGDCYQVNLAQRFTASASGDAFAAYCTLRELNPAPFSAYLNLPEVQILCASPERFLQVRNGRVETRPIKGTRPRMADAAADAQMQQDLRNNPKDRAENLMIVDLLRNDLSKSCAQGSVKTPGLFEIESYATVHHLVSTVVGELAAGHDALSLLRACFPGGSVTGAPKRRAMEIIEQLEPHRRGIYCGAIGYAGFDGNMDTNIIIRTLVYADGEIRCWAGGGIVADSQEEAEYQESLDKAEAMLELLRRHGGES